MSEVGRASYDDPSGGSRADRTRRRQAWGNVVAGALERQNLTVNAAAQKLKVSRNTLQGWLDGRTDPDIFRLGDLAKVADVSHVLLLELAGVLPHDIGSAAYMVQAASALERGLIDLRAFVDQAISDIDRRPAARLIGMLLSETNDWQFTLRPAMRGRRHRILQHTYIIAVPMHDPALQEQQARDELHRLLADLYVPYAIVWRQQMAHDLGEPAGHVLQVPDQERPRSAQGKPIPGLGRILVTGLPYAHAELLGSLVAEALQYHYADLRYGPRAPTLSNQPHEQTAAMVEHAEQLIHDRCGQLVWSLTQDGVRREIDAELRANPPDLTVVVTGGPKLRQRGCEVWEIDPDEMDDAARRLASYQTDAPWPVIQVRIDDDTVTTNGHVDRDLLVDEIIRKSVRVLMEMRRSYRVPGPRAWEGLPGRLFDEQGFTAF